MEFDAAIEKELLDHHGSWMSVEEPIVHFSTWIKRIEIELPYIWTASSIMVAPSAYKTGKEHRIEAKDKGRFISILSRVRIRKDHLLVNWSKAMSLASFALGDSGDSQLVAHSIRLLLDPDDVLKQFKSQHEAATLKLTRAVRQEVCLAVAFDNHQEWQAYKLQRLFKSGEQLEGTYRAFVRQFYPKFPRGTVIWCSDPCEGGRAFIVTEVFSQETFLQADYMVALLDSVTGEPQDGFNPR